MPPTADEQRPWLDEYSSVCASNLAITLLRGFVDREVAQNDDRSHQGGRHAVSAGVGAMCAAEEATIAACRRKAEIRDSGEPKLTYTVTFEADR